MKKFLFIWIFTATSLNAQVTEEWVARYSGSGSDSYSSGEAIAVDNSGNVYVTGSISSNFQPSDYLTIKYNSSGDTQWVARYNGPGNSIDEALDIAIDDAGNVYVTGGGTDYATIKYNSNGVQQWMARYNGLGNGDDIAYGIAVDNSGNVYVTGSSFGVGTNEDYATIKYNSNGDSIWVRRYNSPANNSDDAYDIVIDDLRNVYVTGGFRFTTGTLESDIATIKYDSNGVERWVKIYDGSGHRKDHAKAIAIDVSRNIYVTGSSYNVGTADDYVTIKYDSNGVEQWVKLYDGTDHYTDRAADIMLDGSGYVYVTGGSHGINTDDDYTTIKYNSNGDSQWVARFSGLGGDDDDERAVALVLDNSGNVYVTGNSNGYGSSNDYITIKYNSQGVEQWLMRYDGPVNGGDSPRDIAIDSMGNIYVTGTSSLFGNDLTTIKYTQSVGIHNLSSEIPEQFLLSQNFPNPFNPTTNIKFDIPKKSFVKLVIYNSLGKEVATLVNEELNSGSYQTDWDASEYPSGVYFYRLQTEDFVQTKSMLLLK